MTAAVRPPCDEVVMRTGRTDPAAAAAGARTASWVLTAAILGSSMVFVDGTVVNVALPSIQGDLGTDAAGAQWVIEAYALFLSALLLVGGALGDRLGRRRVFGTGVGLFALSSAVCAAAPSIGVLVAARAAQGAAGALLTPGSLALISASFPPQRRGRAIGTWSGATGITSAAGPLLGGFLVGHLSWRWAFVINLPLAAVVLAITARRVPESRGDERGRLDWLGAALVTAGLGLLVLALIRSQTVGLGASEVLLAGLAAVLLLATFLGVEARVAAAPMLPLGLFRSRPFSVTNLLTLFLYAALGGALVYLPVTLIELHGYSPLAAGASLLPFVIILSVLARSAGGLVDRIGARLPLTVGPLVTGLGFALLAVPGTGGSYWTTFLPGVAVLGLGMALVVAPLTTTVMTSVATSHAGAASGVNNAVARTGGLLAVAVFGVVLLHTFGSGLDHRLDRIALTPAQRAHIDSQQSRLALLSPPDGLDAVSSRAVEDAVAQAFVEGFRAVMIGAAALAVASSLTAAAGLSPGRRPYVSSAALPPRRRSRARPRGRWSARSA